MDSGTFDLLSHSEAIVDLEPPFESIAHIGLDDYTHIRSGCVETLFETHLHESHTIIKRAAEFVAAMVGIWREELRY